MISASLRIAFTGILLFAAHASLAQAPDPRASEAAPASAPASEMPPAARDGSAVALTAEDLSAFLDGMLPAAMATGDIAGAVVTVVKDDRTLVQKGYGFSDMEKRTPVSPDTLFRPGSISKLFTWTAVMQLVEAGQVDLDQDVNKYLDFKLTGYEGKPITVRHLLTHTPGLEEALKDLLLDDVSQMKPLDVVLKDAIPRAIYPPGTVPAYSNYGAALAGYIVQRVSGMPFDDYIEQKIFAPLRMTRSTFRQPVPKEMSALLSNGYWEASGDVVPFEVCPDAPAGALSASGTDMSNFMLAHLNGGMLPAVGESSRILHAETVQLMHTVANTPAPGIDAMALGFYEQNRNGVRAIAHGGDLNAFHSDLLIIPAAKVGIYMSFNSLGRNRATYALRTALGEGFMDRYFPRTEKLPAPGKFEGSEERARAVAGELYELSRRAQTNLFSFIYMLGQSGAEVTEKGTLKFESLQGLNDKPREFQEEKPWHWREIGGEMRVAAVRSPQGDIEAVVPDGYGPIFVFQPVPAWRAKSWLQPAVVLSGIVLAVANGAWLIGAVRRWARRRKNPASVQAVPSPRWLLWSRLGTLGCLVFLLLVGSIILMFSGESFWILSDSATPYLRLIQLFALISVIAAVVGGFAAYKSWSDPQRLRWVATGRVVTALACVVCAYVAVVFHFLTLELHY